MNISSVKNYGFFTVAASTMYVYLRLSTRRYFQNSITLFSNIPLCIYLMRRVIPQALVSKKDYQLPYSNKLKPQAFWFLENLYISHNHFFGKKNNCKPQFLRFLKNNIEATKMNHWTFFSHYHFFCRKYDFPHRKKGENSLIVVILRLFIPNKRGFESLKLFEACGAS